MKLPWKALLAAVLAAATCGASTNTNAIDCTPDTTSSVIAIANLDQQISQLGNHAGVEELLLVRSRFLGDYDALDRASLLGESRFATGRQLLLRAQTRSAVHRFADALADLAAAERAGANADEVAAFRVSIFVAIGRAADAIPVLERSLARNPGFASRSALAGAYAALGRLVDADRLYVEALGDLDTTLPFPYAWIHFARGLMWVEQGRDLLRGEALYKQALAYLPEFVAANIHLAELEIARGDIQSAMPRLERVVQLSNEPEAAALLGMLYKRTGYIARGSHEIELARRRYDSLLTRHPLAFADHASEFYLGPGADPERSWILAQQNLMNRQTQRAAALAIKAAEASGRYREGRELLERYPNLAGTN
jgi:tetratricopeptide (TPR) repeat protein